MSALFTCMVYDREDYAGGRAPESVMPSSGPRFGVVLVRCKQMGESWLWHETLFSRRVETRAEALALVPPGGRHGDRSTNYPSPMVPTDTWDYDQEPPWRAGVEAVR